MGLTAVRAFGDRRIGELRSQEIAAWRMTIPPDVGFANSGGVVFVNESAEEVATTWVSSRVQRC